MAASHHESRIAAIISSFYGSGVPAEQYFCTPSETESRSMPEG